MAQPIKFIVLVKDNEEVVFPPVAVEEAGGNRVSVINTLQKRLTVTHNGHLVGDNPFTVDPREENGPPTRVTRAIAAGSDVPGTVFQINIQASLVRAFGGGGDPTVIIL